MIFSKLASHEDWGAYASRLCRSAEQLHLRSRAVSSVADGASTPTVKKPGDGTDSFCAVYPRMADERENKLSLLVVDDDVRILEIVEHVARQSPEFESVTTAANGRDALAKIFAGSRMPDVILTDLSMPQMDGFELVQTLKQLPTTKHIPVVMFSSSGLVYDQQHAVDAGCAAFFQKPAHFAGLKEVLENVVRIATGSAAPQVA
jgi:CheY-like chemotaxis protein